MTKIKDIPKIDRPREKFLKKGHEALSKSELLSILLGSGIKGTNVKQLSQHIVKKFGKKLFDATVDELKGIPGIGEAKALQIAAAFALCKRLNADNQPSEVMINSLQDVLLHVHELRSKKKEYLVCLYLNARNVLLKKEVVSVGLADQTLLHPREIFQAAIELNAASAILVHNHPSGDSSPSEKDTLIVKKIAQAGEIMGISITDFVIVAEQGEYSFHEQLKGKQGKGSHYVKDGEQHSLFELLQIEKPAYVVQVDAPPASYIHVPQSSKNHFQLHNRRYIGSKYKLLEWIFSVVQKECDGKSFTDIFAGTGVVASIAHRYFDEVILNDFLYSNEVIYKAFLGNGSWNPSKVAAAIKDYNNISGEDLEENYFSTHFGGKYFSKNDAKIIGFIRENIGANKSSLTEREYSVLLSSLLYSTDKIANTVGHYDAYFKKESVEDSFFMRPIKPIKTQSTVSIFREDANLLAQQVKTDIVYIDPPYNSRQYSRFYHVLETLTKWDKPKLYGVALKPERENMSDYCRVSAKDKLAELAAAIDAKYLVLSYNNTYDSKSNSSQNKITLDDINSVLSRRGKTKVFEKEYRHFNAGNTDFNNHKEYLFVTSVKP